VKSVHNLAFNCGQGIALVLTGRFKRMMASLLHLPQLHVMVAVAVLVVALTSMASWLACRIHLFPTTMLGSHATQLAFMFVAFLGSTLIFFCRVLSLIVFSTDRTSFVRISTFEVSASLLLVSTLSYGFGLIGALTGVAIAGGLVLTLSLMCSRRAAQHSLQHCGRCSDSRCGSNRHQ
jgi:hypothetical protein